MIQAAIAKLLDGHDLTREEARGVMNSIMSGEATQAQMGGFLVALRAKGETADEIAIGHDSNRRRAARVHIDHDHVADMTVPHQLRQLQGAGLASASHHRTRA